MGPGFDSRLTQPFSFLIFVWRGETAAVACVPFFHRGKLVHHWIVRSQHHRINYHILRCNLSAVWEVNHNFHNSSPHICCKRMNVKAEKGKEYTSKGRKAFSSLFVRENWLRWDATNVFMSLIYTYICMTYFIFYQRGTLICNLHKTSGCSGSSAQTLQH